MLNGVAAVDLANGEYQMNVVGHDNEVIDADIIIMPVELYDRFLNDRPDAGERDTGRIGDLRENRIAVFGAER